MMKGIPRMITEFLQPWLISREMQGPVSIYPKDISFGRYFPTSYYRNKVYDNAILTTQYHLQHDTPHN